MVKHEQHRNGGIHTIEFTDGEGIDRTMGTIVKPDKYDFGIAIRAEIVRVLSGIITVDDRPYHPGEDITVKIGDRICFSTDRISSYSSYYPREESQ